MQNYVQKGQTLTVVAPYALLSGGGCQVGNIFGVTVNSQNIGDSSELVVEGVFDLAKDASTFNPGDKVFWNNTALQATSSPLTAAGHRGGKMLETLTRLHAAIPAERKASSKLVSFSRCFPTPLVRNIRLATNIPMPAFSWT